MDRSKKTSFDSEVGIEMFERERRPVVTSSTQTVISLRNQIQQIRGKYRLYTRE